MPDRLPDHYDPTAVEQHVKTRWTDADAFPDVDAPAETSHAYEYAKRRAEARAAESGEGEFYFLDGPPFTSGRMHVGNAWGKILKDALLRYHRMQGQAVRARPGYDTHGLPVEVNVEQDYEFETKQAVEEYGVDRFVEECRAFVEDQRAVMDEEFRDLAVWMDWDDPYQTMDPEYVDTVWDAFAALYDRGLVERGAQVVNTCPRCDSDVVMRAAEQWLVRVTDLKADLLDAVDDTTWYPAEARDGRFRNTVANAPDWNVSRQRYWGSPLPVWHCDDCDRDVVVSSRADLADRAGLDEVPDDPHRPVVDDVTVPCPDCGADTERVDDVLDVWFDSAVASWASLRERPSESPTPDPWPADLVVEGNDQTRGWFLMQLYLGVAFADRAPYEEVLMHGWALLDGEGMSKSQGHVLRPPEVAAEHGRDALRAHLLGHEQQGQDVTMSSDMSGVETTRERFDVVWNVVRFATMFMAEDDYAPSVELTADPGARTVLDEWVLARLREVTETATAAFDDREPDRALDAVLDFLVADVSRFYVQTVRDRVWTPESTADKQAAYDALGTVLGVCVRLLAPFAPHLAERLYEALDGPADAGEPTVHATEWPDADALDLPERPALVTHVDALREVEGAVATARQEMGRKHRWPVAEVVVETTDETVAEAVERHRELLAERTNAAAVELTERYPARERVVVPEMDALGPDFRDAAEAVADAVEGRSASDLPLTVTVDGTDYEVTADHVSVAERVPDDVTRVTFDGGTVFVDESLPDRLRREGLARDMTRRAQEMRADLDLAVDERVRLAVVSDDEALATAVSEHAADLRAAVRVDDLRVATDDGRGTDLAHAREWSVDGAQVRLAMEPVTRARIVGE